MTEPDYSFVTRKPPAARALQIVAFNEANEGQRSYETCRPNEVAYKMPSGKLVSAFTTGCGEDTRIEVAYRATDGEQERATVCINDDACHLWPRFSEEAKGRPTEDF